MAIWTFHFVAEIAGTAPPRHHMATGCISETTPPYSTEFWPLVLQRIRDQFFPGWSTEQVRVLRFTLVDKSTGEE